MKLPVGYGYVSGMEMILTSRLVSHPQDISVCMQYSDCTS